MGANPDCSGTDDTNRGVCSRERRIHDASLLLMDTQGMFQSDEKPCQPRHDIEDSCDVEPSFEIVPFTKTY